MVRELRQLIYCDVCLQSEGEPIYTEGFEVKVSFGQQKPRFIGVCEQHEKEWIAPLRTLANAVGVVDSAAPGPGRKKKNLTH